MLIRGAVILKADACLHIPKFIRQSSLITEDQVAIHDPYGNILRADIAILFGCLQQHASVLNMSMEDYIKKMTEELDNKVDTITETVNTLIKNVNTETAKVNGETNEGTKSE